MKIIRAVDMISKPWKNGGGTTREVVIFPEGSNYDDYGWMASAARVARDGPFSHFPNADRTMAILSGTSLSLHGLGPSPVTLTTASAPFTFPGDVPVTAALGGVPIENMNMMVRRDQFGHSMRRLVTSDPVPVKPRGTSIIFLQSGAADVSLAGQYSMRLAIEDSVMSDTPFVLTPQGTATVLMMDVWPLK
jgi:uncharacterized protein